jgi:hypothetical protein
MEDSLRADSFRKQTVTNGVTVMWLIVGVPMIALGRLRTGLASAVTTPTPEHNSYLLKIDNRASREGGCSKGWLAVVAKTTIHSAAE